MAWSSAESSDGDPLTKCQELLRSPFAEPALESTRNCEEFVRFGNYLLTLTTETGRERVYQFKDWRLASMIVQFGHEDFDRVLTDLNSRFVIVEPKKRWRGKDYAAIEIRPSQPLNQLTEKVLKPDDFSVVVSSASL